MEEVASVVEEDIGSSQLAVMRCIIATPKVDPDWRRTAIFHMYFKCGEINCKLIINSGSCMNVLVMSAIARMNRKAETHPQPYKVAWVDETMIPVTQRCLVPIQLGTYSEKIWCDVLPMNIAHVLLGRPWLYDRDVIHYGRSNTYVFTFKGKKVKLNPAKSLKLKSKESSAPLEQKKSLHILSSHKFEQEIKSEAISYALVVREKKDVPSDDCIPKEVQNLLSDYQDLCLKELHVLYRTSEFASSFAQHIHDLHEEIKRKLFLNYAKYKINANSYTNVMKFYVGDYVLVHANLVRFSYGKSKKLTAKKIGLYRILRKISPSAYELELPKHMRINPTFNISDLTPYHEPLPDPVPTIDLVPSTDPVSPTSSTVTLSPYPDVPSSIQPRTVSKSMVSLPPEPKMPPALPIPDVILDDQTVFTTDDLLHRYLIRWRDLPSTQDSWLVHDELAHLHPSLLEEYLQQSSMESNFSKPGRIDAEPDHQHQRLRYNLRL
ncbi:hypothetical protein AXF42_Ash012254 [Apostasia shenzhenica]|uniref:Uncharacterized protein n=1 Tax=Apostasia shenzhenica TaxID=1088818 RepID=A0A2I0B4F6_9ASPA|nr:hypothetical protein AXF42_Ash012254 [Apostasia shenzhenica]